MSGHPIGWDHPDTARYYEAFCERHERYLLANRELVAHAGVSPCSRVLDVGAGTGRTAEEVLAALGPAGCVVCYEPARAMLTAGRARLRDPRVIWTDDWPGTPQSFDAVLCGSAMWQLPLLDTFERVATLLVPDGVFCFNTPSLYIGCPDEPGGGTDPLLLQLPSIVAEGRQSNAAPADALTAEKLEYVLLSAGFRWARWTHRIRLTQPALRDWMKIPVITDALLTNLESDARAARIDEAFRQVDENSWRWESWTGWTARSRSATACSASGEARG